MALIAKAIMAPTSGTVIGRMSVSVVLANFPNFEWSHLGQGDSHILSSKKTGSWTGIVTENEPFVPSRRAVGERKSSYSESDLRGFSSVR